MSAWARSLASTLSAAFVLAAGLPAQSGCGGGRVEERQRGVSWVAGHEITAEHLGALVEIHVNWIVQTPFGWQRNYNSPQIALATDGNVLWGETDAGLETTTRLARERGIKTLLKPHIWLTRPDGKWRADIAMGSEEDWDAWFADYRTFILHYARLAERLEIEALSIGTELRATVVAREADEPALDELLEAWKEPKAAVRRVHRRFRKPVVFTEIGYKSTTQPAARPWEWPGNLTLQEATEAQLRGQATCFESFFRTFWHEPWFGGAYVWKWFPTPRRISDVSNQGFTPQGKAAAEVIGRWYSSERR